MAETFDVREQDMLFLHHMRDQAVGEGCKNGLQFQQLGVEFAVEPGATFSAVRSAHASTRVTERALLAQIRPLLVPTRPQDAPEKISFLDEHWIRAEGGRAVLEVTPEAIYMGFGLRNVGSGLDALLRRRLDQRPVRRQGDGPVHDHECRLPHHHGPDGRGNGQHEPVRHDVQLGCSDHDHRPPDHAGARR